MLTMCFNLHRCEPTKEVNSFNEPVLKIITFENIICRAWIRQPYYVDDTEKSVGLSVVNIQVPYMFLTDKDGSRIELKPGDSDLGTPPTYLRTSHISRNDLVFKVITPNTDHVLVPEDTECNINIVRGYYKYLQIEAALTQ